MLPKWTEDLSVGVAILDMDHQALFKMAGTFHRAFLDGHSIEIILETFDDLIDYTSEHFRNEEYFMDKYDYPSLEDHKKIHENIVDKLKSLRQDFVDGKPAIESKLFLFLKEWLRNHILEEDMKYKEYLNKE
jgi:hemerythrin-like metal-binding protein